MIKIEFYIWVQLCFSHDLGFALINWMLGLLLLDYKIGYLLWFVLLIDTIDDLILYIGSKEEDALDF